MNKEPASFEPYGKVEKLPQDNEVKVSRVGRLQHVILEIGRLVHNDPWRNRAAEEQHFT